MSAFTFDTFLEMGCPPTAASHSYQKHEAKASFIARIRHWRNAGVFRDSELDGKVVARRTNLWRMMLSQESRLDPSAFTVPVIRRSWFFRLLFEPIHICRLVVQFLNLSPHVCSENGRPDFLSVSRDTPYTLEPQDRPLMALPFQRIHVSPFAIPPAVADISCESFDAAGILDQLNDIFGTKVPMDPSLLGYLTDCIEKRRDLGQVYGLLRPWWFSILPFSEIQVRMQSREYDDYELRRNADDILRSTITDHRIPPRRVWDLYSNRTIPFYALPGPNLSDNVWAISHSWVDGPKRHNVSTKINGGEWLVPLPKEISLDHVRIELLNMGAEYVFLDVLCLRQQGSNHREGLREYEWRLDVPTLGFPYRHHPFQTVIIYFNGLGMPFDIRTEVLESPLHWFNRSWTLQETVTNWLPGGLCAGSFHNSPNGPYFMARMREALEAVHPKWPELRGLLKVLKSRPGYADKKPFDRVAALAYLLPNPTRPVYDETWGHAEAAWDALFVALSPQDLFDLIIRYPLQRSLLDWRPSWSQMMADPQLAPEPSCYCDPEELLVPVTLTVPDALFYHTAYVVERCVADDKGRLTIIDHETSDIACHSKGQQCNSKPFEFDAFAPLPTSFEFALVGVADLECWVVGEIERGREKIISYMLDPEVIVIRKYTVGRMYSSQDRSRLRQLGVGRKRVVAYMHKVTNYKWAPK